MPITERREAAIDKNRSVLVNKRLSHVSSSLCNQNIFEVYLSVLYKIHNIKVSGAVINTS